LIFEQVINSNINFNSLHENDFEMKEIFKKIIIVRLYFFTTHAV